jgi:hypothetical protein
MAHALIIGIAVCYPLGGETGELMILREKSTKLYTEISKALASESESPYPSVGLRLLY